MQAEEYLSLLNPSQRKAVEHEGPSLLILAGAGSGKTRVITTKIAYLISQRHVDPYSILAVTFTKKAAGEMRERAVLLEERAKSAQLRTFHSWGAYFLRAHADAAGVSRDFTVYDDDDMLTLVSKSIPSITRKDAAVVAQRISLAKDYGITPDTTDFSVAQSAGLEELSDHVFLEQYGLYQKRLRATGNVDFGDLILLPYQILRDNDGIRHSAHLRHRVIMVDEYQDSNVAQFLLLQQLAGVNDNAGIKVCVVGDDDQSIYKFRGAEVQNILRFKDLFPGTDIIRLETNYRSTPQILSCSNSVISNNSERLGKTLQSSHTDGKKPALVFLPTQDDETQFCAELIQNAHEKGVPYSDWAILYRTNAQSLGFESDFLREKIPYTVVGSLKFYEREEIKDTLSWLAFLMNQKDEVAFRRIVNKPGRGIGSVTQEKIIASCAGRSLIDGCAGLKLSKKAMEGMSAFSDTVSALLSDLPDVPGDAENFNDGTASFSGGAEGDSSGKITSPDASLPGTRTKRLSEFVESVIKKSGLEDYHKAQDDISGTQKLLNLQELVNGAVLYPCSRQGLLRFLDSIELDRSLEEDSGQDDLQDRVTLITLHNTKGLEFPRVIMTGMEYGIFPRENKTAGELEEERRLCYVGITRARQELYLTCCAMRRMYGQTKSMAPSPFLSELGEDNIRVLGQRPFLFNPGFQPSPGAGEASHPLSKKWHVGAGVYHDEWGHGQIVRAAVTEEGEYLISVSFESGGIKKFLPQYQGSSLMLED